MALPWWCNRRLFPASQRCFPPSQLLCPPCLLPWWLQQPMPSPTWSQVPQFLHKDSISTLMWRVSMEINYKAKAFIDWRPPPPPPPPLPFFCASCVVFDSATLTMFVEVRYFVVYCHVFMFSKFVSKVLSSDCAECLEIAKIRPHPNRSSFRPSIKTCVLMKIWWNWFKISMDFLFLVYFKRCDKI